MRVWTWHKPGFSLTEGCVDHTKSEHWSTVPGIQEAYAEISRRLGTDQWVWCSMAREGHIDVPGECEAEWELEVPEHHILAFVDDFVWNKILGIRPAPTRKLRRQLQRHARQMEPDDLDRRLRIEQELEDRWWESVPSAWDSLLVEGPSKGSGSVSALIPHPVPESWVIKLKV